jgi:hypothetical protein
MEPQAPNPRYHTNHRSNSNKPSWFRASCAAFAVFTLFIVVMDVRTPLGLICGVGVMFLLLAEAFGWR